MALIKGITVNLYNKTQTGTDAFGAPVYAETVSQVENVLITPISEDDAAEALNLTGKKIEYELCIPKDDTNEWTNRKVGFFNQVFRTVGIPKELIASMVPLDWNKKVKVERFE